MIDSGSASAQSTCDVDAIAAATLACTSVAGLREGGTHAVATYLPGRRVAGVRVDDRRVVVSVLLASRFSVRLLDAQVRSALAPLVGGREVDVYVADVQTAADLP